MTIYLHIVTVIVKAPAHYRPRQRTYHAACLSKKSSYKGKAIERISHIVKTELAKNNKDVPLEFRVHATTTQVFTLISDNDAKNLEDIQPVSDEHIETID